MGDIICTAPATPQYSAARCTRFNSLRLNPIKNGFKIKVQLVFKIHSFNKFEFPALWHLLFFC